MSFFSQNSNPAFENDFQLNDVESFPNNQEAFQMLNLSYIDVDGIPGAVDPIQAWAEDYAPRSPPSSPIATSVNVVPETPVSQMPIIGHVMDVPPAQVVENILPANYSERENIRRDCRSRSWVGTWNNYPPGAEGLIMDYFDRYSVVGREVGSRGTPHLQIYGVLKNSRNWSALRAKFPNCYWAPARGDAMQNFTYCSKGGDYEVSPRPYHLAVRRNNI